MRDHADPGAERISLRPVPLVPELRVYQADDFTALWEDLEQAGQSLPYWAFPWPGGQAIARYLLDNPDEVAGRSVLDLGTGSGLCAIAAAKAGARRVVAADTDPRARVAAAANAGANGISLEIEDANLIDWPPPPVDVILAGDLFYERGLAARVGTWLRQAAEMGTPVLIGDPARHYFRAEGLVRRTVYDVPTSRDVEGRDCRRTGVYAYLM